MHSPQIVSSKELATQRANSDFKMYDAVLENPPAQEQIDPALESLLQDYLKRMCLDNELPIKVHVLNSSNTFCFYTCDCRE